VLTFKIFIQGA